MSAPQFREVKLEGDDFYGRLLVAVEVMIATDNLEDAKKYLFPVIEQLNEQLSREYRTWANDLFARIYQRQGELKRETARVRLSA